MNANLIIYAAFISMMFACNSNAPTKKLNQEIVRDKIENHNEVPSAYDLNKPNRKWTLPHALAEVSGNTWIDKDHLILIEDNNAKLYYVKIDDSKATLEKTIPFAGNGIGKFDIEDVTYVNGVVYALWSHGDLFKITDWQTKPATEKIKTGLEKENNTEGLCYDPLTKMLLIACKDDPGIPGVKNSAKAVYAFDMNNNRLIAEPFLLINKEDFISVAGEEISFNPSAIAIHPVTYDIYLLTTRDNKGMAVYTHEGILKSYQQIDKDLMPQPEGICFSPEGKLYISSERKMGEPGNLFEFEPYSH